MREEWAIQRLWIAYLGVMGAKSWADELAPKIGGGRRWNGIVNMPAK